MYNNCRFSNTITERSSPTRGGVDYADDLYEDGTQGFCSEDELDQLYQKHLQQQLLLQRLIEEQLQKERNNHCSCCEASNSKAKCITPTISPKDKTANQCLSEGTSSVLSKHAEGCNSLACSRKSEDRCSALRNLYPPSKESSCQCFLPNNRCKLCCQNTQRNYEPSSNCRESSACRAHCEFCSSSRCHHSDHHTKPASNCSNHHQDITNTSAASQQIYSSKSLSSSPRQPTAMTSRRLPTQASSSKPPPLSPSLQLLMTTDNSLQKSQGLNNQTDVNQTSLQRKMPSKIITTMDEICVVIDS